MRTTVLKIYCIRNGKQDLWTICPSCHCQNKPHCRSEIKQNKRKTLKKPQARDTPFKQSTYQGLNFQNLWSSNRITRYLCENTQSIHMSERHFWTHASSFSFKAQVALFYPALYTARHWNHTGTLFNVKIINYFKNENCLNSYRLKE